MTKAFLSSSTVLTFISVDDPAIGIPVDERADAIALYARSMDQRVLKLKPGVEPNKFFVRVLDAEQKRAIQTLLTTDDVKGFTGVLQTDVGRAILAELVQRNVVGYKNFNLVTGFTDNGERRMTRFDCEINGDVHPDVVSALLGDIGFAVNLMLFLMTAGQLSDEEKKA